MSSSSLILGGSTAPPSPGLALTTPTALPAFSRRPGPAAGGPGGSPVYLPDPVNRDDPINFGLTSWWLPRAGIGGGNTVYDLVGTNHSAFNAATWGSDGLQGGCLKFNGTNSYFDVNYSPSLDFSATPFSISVRFYWNQATSHATILYHYSIANHGYELYTTPTLIEFAVNGNAIVLGGNPGGSSRWVRVTVAYTTSGTTRMFVDTTLLSVQLTNAYPDNTSGAIFVGATGSSQFYNGSISDIRLYRGRVLTGTDAHSGNDVYALIDASNRNYPTQLNRLRPVPDATVAVPVVPPSFVDAVSGSPAPGGGTLAATTAPPSSSLITASVTCPPEPTIAFTTAAPPSSSLMAAPATDPPAGSLTLTTAAAPSTTFLVDAATMTPGGGVRLTAAPPGVIHLLVHAATDPPAPDAMLTAAGPAPRTLMIGPGTAPPRAALLVHPAIPPASSLVARTALAASAAGSSFTLTVPPGTSFLAAPATSPPGRGLRLATTTVTATAATTIDAGILAVGAVVALTPAIPPGSAVDLGAASGPEGAIVFSTAGPPGSSLSVVAGAGLPGGALVVRYTGPGIVWRRTFLGPRTGSRGVE